MKDMSENYYEILEIPTDADERQIKRAYHRLARELHPDKADTPEAAREAEDKFSLVSAAYNTLKDADKRAEYDKLNQAQKDKERTAATGACSTATSQVLNANRSVPKKAADASGTGSGAGKRQPMGLTQERVNIAQKAYARGILHVKQGDHAKAVEFFQAAIKNNDTEAVYHAQLAMALLKARKSATRAIEAAQKAIDLEPYNINYKITLAIIFEAIGSKSNAKKIYEEILRWESDNLQAKAGLDALKKGKSAFSIGQPAGGQGGDSLIGKIKSMFKK